jgi:hypothetical protein
MPCKTSPSTKWEAALSSPTRGYGLIRDGRDGLIESNLSTSPGQTVTIKRLSAGDYAAKFVPRKAPGCDFAFPAHIFPRMFLPNMSIFCDTLHTN